MTPPQPQLGLVPNRDEGGPEWTGCPPTTGGGIPKGSDVELGMMVPPTFVLLMATAGAMGSDTVRDAPRTTSSDRRQVPWPIGGIGDGSTGGMVEGIGLDTESGAAPRTTGCVASGVPANETGRTAASDTASATGRPMLTVGAAGGVGCRVTGRETAMAIGLPVSTTGVVAPGVAGVDRQTVS